MKQHALKYLFPQIWGRSFERMQVLTLTAPKAFPFGEGAPVRGRERCDAEGTVVPPEGDDPLPSKIGSEEPIFATFPRGEGFLRLRRPLPSRLRRATWR